MIIQLSSGQGPEECELAVGKLFCALQREFPDMELLDSHVSRHSGAGCYSSMLFYSGQDLSGLEGTVLWICRSPFRAHHKRKNWYVDVSVIPEAESASSVGEAANGTEGIRFERFHCGGKGGQNVNKVETGVRLTHIATGITVTSTQERSQYQNRQNALAKLNAILGQREWEARQRQANDAWKEHTQIIRGNPVRIYEGMEFRRRR